MELQKLVTKPIRFEGVQLTPENWKDVAYWCGASVKVQEYHAPNNTIVTLKIPSLGPTCPLATLRWGKMLNVDNDVRTTLAEWVVRDTSGRFRAYSESDFHEVFVNFTDYVQDDLRGLEDLPLDLLEVEAEPPNLGAPST